MMVMDKSSRAHTPILNHLIHVVCSSKGNVIIRQLEYGRVLSSCEGGTAPYLVWLLRCFRRRIGAFLRRGHGSLKRGEKLLFPRQEARLITEEGRQMKRQRRKRWIHGDGKVERTEWWKEETSSSEGEEVQSVGEKREEEEEETEGERQRSRASLHAGLRSIFHTRVPLHAPRSPRAHTLPLQTEPHKLNHSVSTLTRTEKILDWMHTNFEVYDE